MGALATMRFDSADKHIRIVHVMTVVRSLNFLRGQSGYLRDRGFEFDAFANLTSESDRRYVPDSVTFHACPITRRVSPLADLVGTTLLLAALRRLRPHVVHAHTPKGGLLGMVAAWLARTPVRIYHMRGLPMTSKSGMKRLLLRWSEKVSCRLSHQVLCVSHSLRDVAVSERLCPAGKIKVLASGSGQGVDAAVRFNPERTAEGVGGRVRRAWGIPQDVPVLGFVGRIVRDKGVSELVAAWKRLVAMFPSLHLLIAGPFEPQDPVGADVEHMLREASRLHLMGIVAAMPSFYARVDVLVLPTYREGFPNVLLEAAAMEVPVVATRIPGCVDAVEDGVTGTLVPVHDAEALADAVECYLRDPQLRCRHGRAGRQRVLRNFRPEVVWEAMYREYVRLLQQKGLPVPAPCDAPTFRKVAA